MGNDQKEAAAAYVKMQGDAKNVLRQGAKELAEAAKKNPFGRVALRALQARAQKDPMSVEELVEGLFEEMSK